MRPVTVGFMAATGGQGKTTIATTVAITEALMRHSYYMNPIAFIDGDVASPIASSLLLGGPPTDGSFEDFLIRGVKDVTYKPNPRQLEQGHPAVEKLYVIPSKGRRIGDIVKLTAGEIRDRLESLLDMLASLGVDRVYIDFPAGNPVLARLASGLASMLDGYVLVVKPSPARISAAYRLYKQYEELSLLAVVLNCWREDQPYNPRTGRRWEAEVSSLFGMQPFKIPYSFEWELALHDDSIPFLKFFGHTAANEAVADLTKFLFNLKVEPRGEPASIKWKTFVEVDEEELVGLLSNYAPRSEVLKLIARAREEGLKAEQIVRLVGRKKAVGILLKLGFSLADIEHLLQKR